MRSISYKVQCPEGLHARPAGMLTRKLKEYACDVTLTKGDASVNARKLFSVMTLLVKQGDDIVMNPNPALTFCEGDIIILAGEKDNITQLQAMYGNAGN